MFAIHKNVVPELESWGTVADLGSEILEGEGLCFGKMVHGSPDMPLCCGYFSTVRGKFRMTYPFSEHAVVVEGKVTLTDEASGEATTYGPGDGWFVEKGTPILWEIHSDRFTKNYVAVA